MKANHCKKEQIPSFLQILKLPFGTTLRPREDIVWMVGFISVLPFLVWWYAPLVSLTLYQPVVSLCWYRKPLPLLLTWTEWLDCRRGDYIKKKSERFEIANLH